MTDGDNDLIRVPGVVTGNREQVAVMVEPRVSDGGKGDGRGYVELSLATSDGTLDVELEPSRAFALAGEVGEAAAVVVGEGDIYERPATGGGTVGP